MTIDTHATVYSGIGENEAESVCSYVLHRKRRDMRKYYEYKGNRHIKNCKKLYMYSFGFIYKVRRYFNIILQVFLHLPIGF